MNLSINLNTIREMAENDEEFVVELLGAAKEELNKAEKELPQETDPEKLAGILHKIKPTLFLLGLQALGEKSQVLIKQARETKILSQDEISDFKTGLHEVISQIDDQLNKQGK